MKNKPSEDLYTKYLQTICGIKFTRRQIDVISCVASGWTIKEIGRRLSIAPSTVESHLDLIAQKLGSGGRSNIIEFVEKSGKSDEIRRYYKHLKGNESTLLEDDHRVSQARTFSHKYKENMKARSTRLIILGVVVLLISSLGLLYLKMSPTFLSVRSISSELPLPHKSVLLKRKKLLEDLDKKLKNNSGIQTVVLAGVGGSGKTTLARHYGRLQKANVIWEINAETHVSLIRSFEILAYSLTFREEDKRELRLIKEIKESDIREKRLLLFIKQRLKGNPGWILIYDNVETFSDIQNFFPYDSTSWGKGKIIITTRDSNIMNNSYIGADQVINPGELSSEDKFKLFTKIIGQKNNKSKKDIKQFLKHIPHYPLDTSTAAYYIKDGNISYKQYLHLLSKQIEAFSVMQKNVLKEVSQYSKTRYDIIALPLRNLVRENTDFRDLLFFISLLDSQNIPKDLLKKYKNSISVDDFVHYLKRYSLITDESLVINNKTSAFSVHRSSHKIIPFCVTEFLSKKDRISLLEIISDTLIKDINEALENKDTQRVSLLEIHTQHFLDNTDYLDESIRDSIMGRLGLIYDYLGYTNKATDLINKSIQFKIKKYGKNHFSVAEQSIHLANIQREAGNYEEAINLIQENIEIYKKHYKQNPQKIAWALISFSNIQRELGQYSKAETQLKKSIRIYENYYGKDHIKVADVKRHLANTYRTQGQYALAESIFEECLQIFKEYYGEDHLKVSLMYVYLGNISRELGDYNKSINLLYKGLTKYKKHYGPLHTETGWVLIYLGNAYREMGCFTKAKEVLKEGLSIYKSKYDQNNILIGWTNVLLGDTLRELKDYKNSKNILNNAFEIYKKYHEEEHIRTKWVLINIARLHIDLGEYKHAQNLLINVLESFINEYGENHLRTAEVFLELGRSFLLDHHYGLSNYYLNKSLQAFSKISHLNEYLALENLSNLYWGFYKDSLKKGDQLLSESYKEKSVDYLQKSMAIIKNKLPNYSSHFIRINNALKFRQE